MSPEATAVIAALEQARATSADELERCSRRIAEQLSAGMVDGRVLPPAALAEVRAAVAAHVGARRAARDAHEPPPPVPDWPELDAIRALPAELVELNPGVTSRGFAQELASRRAPVPPDLLALLAASDGLTLHNRYNGEVVLSLLPADRLQVVERLGHRALLLASWSPAPRAGFTRQTVELWLAGDQLGGGSTREHPGQKPVRTRFGNRRFDARDLLSFGLARVEARFEYDDERELGIVAALSAELSWPWYFAGDAERFDLLVRARRPARARAYAEWLAARLLDDAAGDTRAGDHGAASKAERAAEEWLARARALET